METINLVNCCYPPEQNRTYLVQYEHVLQHGALLRGQLKVKINPGQNLGELQKGVDEYLAQTNTIYYSNYTLIKQI